MKQPLGDRVIIEPEATASVTESNIVIPDSAKSRPQKGTVAAAGDKCTKVKAGTIVYYGKFAGQEFPIEGDEKEYLIMRESEILAID